jgi:pimeloyl-ACP methyl ester carboxylesterase
MSASKPTLVLVPGLVCDPAVWAPQVKALARDAQCLIADHGLADDLGAMAERVLAVAPARFALAGHSMGGRVALEVMARAPERVTHLALLDTGVDPLPAGAAGDRERAGRMRLLALAREQGMRAMGAEWLRGMLHPDRLQDTALVGSVLDMIERSSVEQFAAQLHALLARPDRRALLAGIAVPTLVLCGHEDAWSPIARHHRIAAAIADSVLVDVPDCGHMSTLEQADIVSAALLAWLHEVRPPYATVIDPQEG